jgi:hypothetical protein
VPTRNRSSLDLTISENAGTGERLDGKSVNTGVAGRLPGVQVASRTSCSDTTMAFGQTAGARSTAG